MKSTTFAAGSLLASLALAQPHLHKHRHNQRQEGAAVKWVTEVTYTTEIVDITTTIWVSEGYVAPTTPVEAPSSPTAEAAQFFEPAATTPASVPVATPEPVVVPTTSSFSSVYVAPAPETTSSVAPIAPVEQPAAPSVVAPKVEETPTPSPTPIATPIATPIPSPSPVAAPIVAQAVASSSSPAVAATTQSSSSDTSVSSDAKGATSGNCNGPSELCGGDITYYDTGYPGYGSCGDQTDGTVEPVVAIPWEFMGTKSNGNPFCHRKVKIFYGGKSVVASVVDKCMGCKNRDLDLSHAAFQQLSDEGIGRTQATWYFLD